MFFADRLTLGTPRRTKEGYLAVRAKAARAGVYDYLGREIDPDGNHFAADQVVKVYRPEEEVFATDSVHSFLLKPITDDHPRAPVTASSWASQAKGVNAGALRDGEYLAFDLVIMDAATIEKVEGGKRELSNGYSSEISIEDGTAPDGAVYQAVQRHIRGNHVAIVKVGRAGPECRIGDVATCDAATVELIERLLDGQTYADGKTGDNKSPARRETSNFKEGGPVATKLITFDGLPVEVTDAAEAVIVKLQGQLADAAATLGASQKAVADEQAKVVERDATITAKDTKISELEAALADAVITPAKLADAAKAYADVCGKAKAMGVTFAEDDDADAVKKAVVVAKMGDAAKDYGPEHITIAFDALTKDAKVDPVIAAIASQPAMIGDADKQVADARAAMLADLKGEAPAKAA